MTYWESVFLQSKVNRGAYDGDRLPTQNWDWPRETWFQKRLRYLRKTQQLVHDNNRAADFEIAPQISREYKLPEAAGLKEFSHGMPTMFYRERGQIPGLH